MSTSLTVETQTLEVNLGPQYPSTHRGSMEGAKIAFDFFVEADQDKRYNFSSLGPDDANRSASTSLKDLLRVLSVQEFDAKANGSLAGLVVRSNLLVGCLDEGLFVSREPVEALKVALLIDELHSSFLHAPFQDLRSGSLVCNDVTRFDRQGLLEERLVGLGRDAFFNVDRF